MKTNEYKTTIITAADGKYITNADDNVDIKDRLIATSIALGKFDSVDNYKEITKEEADELKAAQEKAQKEAIETQNKVS